MDDIRVSPIAMGDQSAALDLRFFGKNRVKLWITAAIRSSADPYHIDRVSGQAETDKVFALFDDGTGIVHGMNAVATDVVIVVSRFADERGDWD